MNDHPAIIFAAAMIFIYGLGAVLVTRLVGIKEEETYRLPANYDDERGYIGYYNHAWKETSGGHEPQSRHLHRGVNI